MVGSTEIIGRDAELASIERFLGESRPGGLVVDGEAGIGKSTLWDRAIAAAHDAGDQVLSWRASSAERQLAFSALIGLWNEAAEGAEPGLDPRRRAALDRALGRNGNRTATPDDVAGSPEPTVVGLAVLDVLRALSADGPVTLGLDDVQWCDPASAAVLAFAVRRLRTERVAVVLAVRRESGRQPSELESAIAPGRQTRLPIGPLTVGAIGRLIRERLGIVHPRPLLVRIHEASRGNPFVALEMSRSLLARGVEPGPGEPFPVSPETEPLVRDHLARLSPTARQCLLLVALTRQPTIELLGRVVGPEAGVAIDEACRAGVLAADGSRLSLAHPLYGSTAYADAPPGERRAARAALAEAVADPIERAIHRSATVDGAHDGVDPDVVRELVEAARLAAARGAPSIAADLLLRAANVLGPTAPPDTGSGLRREAASLLHHAGDADAAARTLRDVLGSIGPGLERARILLDLGEVVYLSSPPDALPLLIEALEHARGDPILEATAQMYVASMGDSDPETSYRSALEAPDTLRRSTVEPDPDLRAAVHFERAYQLLLRAERLASDDIDEGFRLLTGSGNSFAARNARERAERSLFHVGRLQESMSIDETEYQRLSEAGQLGLLPPHLQGMSVLAQLMGDWPAAHRYAEECLELVEQGEEVWRHRAVMALGRVLAWEGELEEARRIGLEGLAREESTGDLWEATIFRALLGFIELSVPDPRRALDHLTAALRNADDLQVAVPTVFRFLGDLVEAAVLSGELEMAERMLEERLDRPAQRVPLPWILAVAARGHGLLASARGSVDEAIDWFDRGIAVLETTTLPFELGRTIMARGQAHLRAGHRRLARGDLDAALAVFDGLGAKAWAARTRAELGRIGGRAASRWELTVSERSVAELAAGGRSNREIADQLVLSVRTVESHLAAAYRKLGVRSRIQLAPALAQGVREIE